MKQFITNNYKWIIFLILVSAGSMFAELINHKMEMADLEVYYKAASRLLDGSELYRDVEEDPYEHYIYKYSPPAALFFVPFLAFGFTLSKYIYWILLTFILGSVLYSIRSVFNKSQAFNISLILGIIIVGTHFFRELHLGQVNLMLLGIYVYALLLLKRNKPAGFAVVIAASIFIKPFGLIFVPLLLITKRWKELLFIAGFSIVLFLIPLIFYRDIHEYWGLYNSWLQELSIELGNKQDLAAEGNHTIFSVLYRFSPLAFIHIGGVSRNLYQMALLLLMGLFLLRIYFKAPVPDRDDRLYIILISLIPLLAFTSYNAFIFVLPLLLFLLFKFKELNLLFRIIFILSSILIGVNIYDLVGPGLYNLLWGISVYTWGTLGLLLTLFINWRKVYSIQSTV